MFDFVSIVFDNDIEISLLKIQLYSFKFVDYSIIDNIYILFNDKQHKNIDFMEKYNKHIIQFCPISLINKINIIFISDLINLNDKSYKSDWRSQQFVKLYVSKIIKSKYYIVLDSKNHFIKYINKSKFMIKDKIILYHERHGDPLLNYYKNGFDYFGINSKDYNPYKFPLHIQTTTPFVFITKECINLISYIEKKEMIDFYDFFYYSKKYTEFFLYFAWLCFVKKHNDEYIYINKYIDNVIVGPIDPRANLCQAWKDKQNNINNRDPSVFSFSRKCLNVIDYKYKQNVKGFYNKIYDNQIINDEINNILQI